MCVYVYSQFSVLQEIRSQEALYLFQTALFVTQ